MKVTFKESNTVLKPGLKAANATVVFEADHTKLENRDAENSHPMEAITGLTAELESKETAGTADTAITTHNNDAKAHPDIRQELTAEVAVLDNKINNCTSAIAEKMSYSDLQAGIDTALAQAKASGEFDGKDGKDGADGAKGDKGDDGVSPVATVTQTTDGAQITITDKSGTTTATIVNGKNGVDGKDGAQGAQGEKGADGHSPVVTASKSGTVTTISVDGTAIATINDGEKGADGAQGKDGAAGTDGKTPVKGTDYWTDADKSEIVADTKNAIDLSSYAEKTELENYLPLTGGTCTGGVIAPNFQTGSDNNSYFQTKKMRGQGDANTYNHAVDWGFAGHDRVDFYEYGATWNFYQCQSANVSAARLVGSIKYTGWNGGAVLTGTPTAPTAATGTNTTQIATTAFVQSALPTKTSQLTNDSNFATTSDISDKADIASPALTGTPTAPTATAGTNTTQIATTEFVTTAITNALANLDASEVSY